jgi:hypothetical protein
MYYRINGIGTTDSEANFIVALIDKFSTHQETVKTITFKVVIDHQLIDDEHYAICEAKLREFGYDIEGRA